MNIVASLYHRIDHIVLDVVRVLLFCLQGPHTPQPDAMAVRSVVYFEEIFHTHFGVFTSFYVKSGEKEEKVQQKS